MSEELRPCPCFDNNASLCKRYFEITDFFDRPDYGEEDIDICPGYFCKICVKKYKELKKHMKEVK